MVNLREGWRGHLWQGRFASFVLDEPYLLTAARYVELNPVRAGLVKAPGRYQWSSHNAAHVRGKDDALALVASRLPPHEASVRPSGENVTHQALSAWSASVYSGCCGREALARVDVLPEGGSHGIHAAAIATTNQPVISSSFTPYGRDKNCR